MRNEELEGLVRRYWQEIWNEGNLAVVAELYAPDCVHGDTFSIEAFQHSVARQRASFPDFHVSIEELFSVGDRVIDRVVYHGTHLGPYAGLAPQGSVVRITGMDIFRIRAGKIIEHWHEADHYGLLLQLGAVFTRQEAEQA